MLADLAHRYVNADPFAWDAYGRTGHDLFRTFAFLIIGQAITKTVTMEQYDGLAELTGRPPTPDAVARLAAQDLNATGIAPFKTSAPTALAHAITAGRLDLQSPDELLDEQICQVLTVIPGLGRWTVELFLIRGLHRPDVIPASDPSIKRAIQQARSLPAVPTPTDIDVLAGCWRPYRSFAATLLWESLANSHTEITR